MNIHDWLRQEEGFRGKPYRCSAGKLTIGYGRNLEDVGISSTEADQLLLHDVTVAELGLATLLGTTLTEDVRMVYPIRYQALVQMSFQLGISRLSGFKRMLGAVKQGYWDYASVEALDSKWAREDTPERAKRVAHAIRYNEYMEKS